VRVGVNGIIVFFSAHAELVSACFGTVDKGGIFDVADKRLR
jgi:hypothetical protein